MLLHFQNLIPLYYTLKRNYGPRVIQSIHKAFIQIMIYFYTIYYYNSNLKDWFFEKVPTYLKYMRTSQDTISKKTIALI